MNKCEGAFRLHRSMLSRAERQVRLVSLQKDELSQLFCSENTEASSPSTEWQESSGLYPVGLGVSKVSCAVWAPEFTGEGEERELEAILQLEVGLWNSGIVFHILNFCKQLLMDPVS